MITQDELKRAFTYDPETGDFTFNRKVGGMQVGDIAGYIQADGYRAISYKGVQYKAHRLAWLYMTGEFPKNHIDHINLIRDANWFCNLREATRSQNGMNRKAYSNNKLACKGVHMAGNSYRALIRKDGKQICLGLYKTIAAAKEAYNNAASIMHGDFARLA